MKRRTAISFLMGLACPLAAVIGVACRRAPVQPVQIPFDAPSWRAGDSKLRGRMYQDLERQLNTTKPSRETVETLLGAPTTVNEGRDYQGIEWISLNYKIDTRQSIATYLGIMFHKSGEFQVASIWD